MRRLSLSLPFVLGLSLVGGCIWVVEDEPVETEADVELGSAGGEVVRAGGASATASSDAAGDRAPSGGAHQVLVRITADDAWQGWADGEVLAQKMEQYKRVFPRLDVVGWYTTGGGLQDSYLEFHKVISAHNASPVLLLMDPNFTHHAKDLPITLYETGLHVIDGNPSVIFVQAAYSIETSEEERVAVDHIAKIAPKVDTNAAVLGAHLEKMIESVTMLHEKIGKVYTLLQEMKAGTVPKDHQFLRGAATLIQSLPLATDAVQKELLIEQMDGLLVTYLATMTKGTATVNALADKMAVSYDRGARRRAL